MFDLRVRTPSRILVVGPSQSGKTYRVFQFLKYRDSIFDKPECANPDRVYCFYKIWTDVFEENKDLVGHWINKFPSASDLQDIGMLFKNTGGCCILIDDWEEKLNSGIADFFKNLSHHLKITTFLILQNLFPSKKIARDISLQASHVVIFFNRRDKQQFSNFARQYSPKNYKYLLDAYKLLEQQHSYLWFDCSPGSHPLTSVRSHISLTEWPIRVYHEKNKYE